MKDRKITFRVTQEEYTLIDEMKKTETRFTYGGRWDLSAYIRNLVLSQTGKKDVRVDMELKDLNYQIRKIGVNINQATKQLHIGYEPAAAADRLEKNMKILEQQFEKMKEELKQTYGNHEDIKH